MPNWTQIYLTTAANLKSRYRGTFAGFLWVALLPVLTFAAQAFAFKIILKIEIENYYVFLVSGLIPWIFIQTSVDTCAGIFVNNGKLLKSFPISPLTLLAAQLLDNFVNFIAAFLLVLIPMALLSKIPIAHLLLVPLCMSILVVGVFGLTWATATLNVFFRDLRFVVSFVLSCAFFLTPIIYTVAFIPEEYRWLTYYNPLFMLIQPFQHLSATQIGSEFWLAIMRALIISLCFIVIAKLLWHRKRNEIFKEI